MLPSAANGSCSSVASGRLADGRSDGSPSPTLPPFHRTASVAAAMSSSAAWASTPATHRRTLPSGVASLAIWCAR